MVRRLWLTVALASMASLLGGPAHAQAAGGRPTVQLVDASVEADDCQYRPSAVVCSGKVVLRAKRQGNLAYTVLITADKVTVKIAKSQAAKTAAKSGLGSIGSVVAEGNVHYDLLQSDQAAATSTQVVGDCQTMTYDAAAESLVLANGGQPTHSKITNTRPAQGEGATGDPETTVIDLDARQTLQVFLRDEADEAAAGGK